MNARKAAAMRIALIGSALLAAACQATPPAYTPNAAPPPASRPAVQPRAEGDAVSFYQYAGSRQCERGGKSPEALRSELAAAGLQVRDATCGHDGRMYAQACGTPDGRILIVRVPHGQAAAAARLGLKPLRDLPEAMTVACR